MSATNGNSNGHSNGHKKGDSPQHSNKIDNL